MEEEREFAPELNEYNEWHQYESEHQKKLQNCNYDDIVFD